MRINYVNPDHVHVLVDLPTSLAIEEMMHLLKGASSHWINENNLLPCKFGWGRGYGIFSVSHSGFGEVADYIAGSITASAAFRRNCEDLWSAMGSSGRRRKPLKTVPLPAHRADTPMNGGVNEICPKAQKNSVVRPYNASATNCS